MHDRCPVCNQKFDLEPGFWYGTGYVSYGLLVLFSAVTFIAWWLVIGISINDDRIIYWPIFNTVLIVILQPWIMRLSRVIYLYIFVHYTENYEKEETQTLSQH
jgi:hypothetical protein